MIFKRSRLIVLAGLVLLGATVMLSWTQTWFTIVVNDGTAVDVLGSDAVGSLAALALAVFALVAALSLSSVIVRRVLGVVAAGVGGAVILVTQSALEDPLRASSSLITEATGISGAQSLRGLVDVVSVSGWPVPAIVGGGLIVVIGLFATFSAHRWPVATKKYDRATTVVADDPASQWDAQSRGIDPTAD
ncbi:Trp biosynthesis-associated membrane protein [Salinibacterium sp. TMP30]|uniref:Trp biosynthesis-associated membrane protein n=1 Tax=Salinibacterium sp. TMP30 TaxID=3138237 RepID=UPI003138B280